MSLLRAVLLIASILPAPLLSQAPEQVDAAPTDAVAEPQLEPQPGPLPVPVPSSGDGPATDEPDGQAAADRRLSDYIHGATAATMRRERLAGVLVAVVSSDRVRVLQGHGIDRLDPSRAVDPQRSMFRIGSISKTFTYTATMQLVEQGRVALDDPVRQHLPEALWPPDEGFAEPIRVRHLLSHTAGFEDTVLGHLFEREPDQVLAAADYLQRYRPHRVREPGTLAVYSNYSVALLGVLVAHVTGTPFEQYIEQSLTGPLGMHHSSFREPLPSADPRNLPAELAGDISSGFSWRDGGFVSGDFEHIAHGAPAGGMSSTAADMARWMQAHLRLGELDGVRILRSDSAQRMRGVLHSNAPGAAAVEHGWLTQRFGDLEAFGHAGATLMFHSQMVLIPELDLGIFVSTNTASGREPMRDLVRLIVEFEAPATALQPAPAFDPGAAALARLEGHYLGNRRPYRSAEKLLLGLGAVSTVRAVEQGLLLRRGSDVRRLLPEAPLQFRVADSDERVVFLQQPDGSIAGFVDGHGILVHERLSALQLPQVLFGLLAAALWIGLARLWRMLRPRKRATAARPGLPALRALSIATATAWVATVLLLGSALVLLSRSGHAAIFEYPQPVWLAALIAATIAAALSAIELLTLPLVWRSRWRFWPKLRHTLGVVLLALTVWVMHGWNLIGVRL